MVERFEGKTRAIKLEDLKYTLQEGSDVIRFDARISFSLNIDEMESTSLAKLLECMDATVIQLTSETEKAKSKRPMKRTIIID